MKKCISIILIIAMAVTVLMIPTYAMETAPTVTEIVSYKYDDAGSFSEGLARVELDGKWGFIDTNGNEVVSCKYGGARDFSGGFALVSIYDANRADAKWGMIDATGKEVVPCQYDQASELSDGLAAVCKDYRAGEGEWGYINETGEVVPPLYQEAKKFSNGLALVKRDGVYSYIDTNGREVIPPLEYDFAYTFSDGLAKVSSWKTGTGFIDTAGKEVIPCTLGYDAVGSFHHGLCRVGKGEGTDTKWGYIDITGKEVIPCQYDGTREIYDGYILVYVDGDMSFIDFSGKAVIPFGKYDRIDDFSNGCAVVHKGLFEDGVIDNTGAEVVPLGKYDDIEAFSDGLAAVKKGNLWGFIDTTGKEVVPCTLAYGRVYSPANGIAKIRGGAGSKYGFISISTYVYDATDPGESVILLTEQLNNINSSASATKAVQIQTQEMTSEQKASATGTDLATLYAETAVSKAASKEVRGNEIIINKAAVIDLEAVAAQTSTAVETALVNGGVSTARMVSNTVTLTTDETGEISIKIDPDILATKVDKIRVETPTYAITLKVADLKEDLTEVLTITAEDVGSGFAPGNQNKKTTVKVNLPKGKTANPVTLSLPKDGDDTTYQAVVKTDGSATSSKYNPATTTMDGKVNSSGSYTVQTNQKDFTDITNKSAEMQKAIRYLASKGIINGTSATEFSPDGSINRAEIAALLVRALGKLDNGATNSFTDVKSSDWYYSTAGSSQKCGLINGYTDNTFRGTTPIIKDQILAVAARVLKNEMGYKEPSDPNSYLAKYSDTVTKWAQPEVALATKENLVVYRVDGTFKGESNMTRGDAAIIIYRLFQKIW